MDTAAKEQQLLRFVQIFRYVAPILVFGYFLISTTISTCTLQNLKAQGTGPRKVSVSLVCLVVISFVVDSCMLLTDTAVHGAHQSSTDSNVSWKTAFPHSSC